MSNQKVPNLNSFGTLVDRLSVEVVKRVTFEDRCQQAKDDNEIRELKNKIDIQRVMIGIIKTEMIDLLNDVFMTGKYEVIGETRTFENVKEV
jgi:hypothetical protein